MNTLPRTELLATHAPQPRQCSTKALLARLEHAQQQPYFILAPRSSGQDELLQAYLEQKEGATLLSVYASDDAGRCLLLEQRQQRPQDKQQGSGGRLVIEQLPVGNNGACAARPEGSEAVCAPAAEGAALYEEQIVRINFVPWLEDEAAQQLSDHIDSFLEEGHTVFVCCAPQNDRYQNLQSDRVEISGLELKQSGLFAAGSYTAMLKQFLTEFLPLQVRLVASLVAVLGQTNLEELERLNYHVAPDLPKLLEQLNPLFTATQQGSGIRAEPLVIPQIKDELFQIIGEYLEEQGQCLSISALASRLTALSMTALEKNDLEASHQILEMAEELIGRSVGRTTQTSFNIPLQGGFVDRSGMPQNTVYTTPQNAAYGAPQTPQTVHAAQTAPVLGSGTPVLSLRLFGKLELAFEGELLTNTPLANSYLSRTKIRRLLVYLAFNQQRAVSRDSLIDYLWPHLDFDRAQKNLYTSWCMLAKGLGSERVRSCPYIRRNGELYQLDSELVVCDIQQFEGLARTVLFGNAKLDAQTESLLQMEA
ncbi:MAG: hypothetical protein LBJ48_03810, partial [Coriobacteriales bacterium]|nr:hypothetical protein [Coriobacteriales bacterium]